MATLIERFLRYVQFDTESSEETGVTPSTPGQRVFAEALVEEMKSIVLMTQETMDEVAEPVVDAAGLLAMRETAKEIPVMDELVTYAMRLVASTHPDAKEAGETAKRYIRLGASPRAGQALITAAKVRALTLGRLNVAREDIDALALPVLRHRVKLSYDALAERMTEDEVIARLLHEQKTAKRKGAR